MASLQVMNKVGPENQTAGIMFLRANLQKDNEGPLALTSTGPAETTAEARFLLLSVSSTDLLARPWLLQS